MALSAAGHANIKVNPHQVRRFAEATGKLAKTYRLDARVPARIGTMLELQPRLVRSKFFNELKDLHIAREALIKSARLTRTAPNQSHCHFSNVRTACGLPRFSATSLLLMPPSMRQSRRMPKSPPALTSLFQCLDFQTSLSQPEKRPKLQSRRSCENSLCSQTHCSKQFVTGLTNQLDQNGHSN